MQTAPRYLTDILDAKGVKYEVRDGGSHYRLYFKTKEGAPGFVIFSKGGRAEDPGHREMQNNKHQLLRMLGEPEPLQVRLAIGTYASVTQGHIYIDAATAKELNCTSGRVQYSRNGSMLVIRPTPVGGVKLRPNGKSYVVTFSLAKAELSAREFPVTPCDARLGGGRLFIDLPSELLTHNLPPAAPAPAPAPLPATDKDSEVRAAVQLLNELIEHDKSYTVSLVEGRLKVSRQYEVV